ncbi:MAG: endolytic transglycosylase MltG [Bacteroidales bacterium]
MDKKSGIPVRPLLMAALIIVIICGILLAYLFYRVVYAPNTDLGDRQAVHLHIPSGSSYEDVRQLLKVENVLSDIRTFDWLAQRKNYPAHVLPGRYRIQYGMGNNELINMLRSGEQEPLNLTFTNIQTKEQLAGTIASRLETDSLSIIRLLNDEEILRQTGFTRSTIKLLFIPNTYEVYWTISPEQLLSRMQREYKAFWNETRREKAADTGLSPQEVGILASIVQKETSKQDEMARIAGVYINRLNRGILLQSDPTVVYAHGDFTINRVLNRHLDIDSPYNTYKYAGLPPGPITLPEPAVVDAVLNYEQHNYLYFSAREDFSGYHNFAETYAEHLANARRYRQALTDRRIFR